MGQTLSRTSWRNILRRRRKENCSNEAIPTGDEAESLPTDPVTIHISGRTYVFKDAHWTLEVKDDLRPLERDPRANKMADILIRENSSLRLKISRLLDMLQIKQDVCHVPVLDKKIGSPNAPQTELKASAVKLSLSPENDPTSMVNRLLGHAPPSTPLLFRISDPGRIGRRLEGMVFGVGQPLLDVVARVTPEFLKSFNIQEGEEVHEIGEHEMGIVGVMFEVFPVEYLTGGSAQNSVIMTQWLLAVPKATTFAGCVGKDNIGDILTKTLTEAGINIILQVHEGHETGLCVVFESSRGRRMALRVGAMKNSIRAALDQPQHSALLRKARCFYAEAYTLTYGIEAAVELGRYAAANDRYFCLNLSATHASLKPTKDVAEILPYADVVFGGETDVQAYAELLGVVEKGGGLDKSALGVSGWRKENGLKGRLVVVVRSTKDTLVVNDGELATFPSMLPGPGNVVDDIGFGDAFAGAFMALLVLGGSVDECLEAGVRAATFSLFQRGCAPPKSVGFDIRKVSRRESVSL